MSSDNYDILSLPVNLEGIVDREETRIKPFVGVYFPVELLKKMGWDKDTSLILSIEKGYLKIQKRDDEPESNYYDLNELTYTDNEW